jgi:hypothetical protein
LNPISKLGSSDLITSVDLYNSPNGISNLILNVTPQLENSGQVTFAGQRMTASYAAVGNNIAGYADTNSISAGLAPDVVVNESVKLQVAYGISDGTVYGSDNVPANLSLTVGPIIPDPKNTGKQEVSLDWTPPLTPDGTLVGQTMGYLVNYQLMASKSLTLGQDAFIGETSIYVSDTTGITVGENISGNGIVTGTTVTAIDPLTNMVTLSFALTQDLTAGTDSLTAFANTPYLTYLKGTSQDLTGTAEHPQLVVNNLPSSFTDPYSNINYYFDPTPENPNAGYYTDPNTQEQVAITFSYNFKVTAQETVLPAYTNDSGDLIAQPVSLFGGNGNDVIYGGLLQNTGTSVLDTRPVLTNRPNPLDNLAGLIPSPYGIGNSPEDTTWGLFPVYENGGLGGNDLLAAPFVNDGSGDDFTAYEYLNGVPTAVTYSGLCTLEGGQGSDTFYVANGGTSLSTLNGVVTTGNYDQIIKYGNETPLGEHNLVISGIRYLSLSDAVVSRGMFIDQAWAPYGGQYIGGNRLDNTIASYSGADTLLGAGGRDLLDASNAGLGDTLIGGTAYGLDSISGALADYAAGQVNSIYRDTDPVPVQPGGLNGPGTADNSQYWMVNGGFDPLRNSDTLLGAIPSANVLDGGAGNDSMVGGTKNDTLYVSSRLGDENNGSFSSGDIVIGGGGNDWIVYTGSDYYWSGISGATTSSLGYALSNNGDAEGGQSISNIKLQDGDPIALRATGNSTSTGMGRTFSGFRYGGVSYGIFSETELGSNQLIGNEFSNTLNGGGVGDTNGTGVGCDTLTGGSGADAFIIGAQYKSSTFDYSAAWNYLPVDAWYGLSDNRSDGDYALVTDFSSSDTLVLSGSAANYFIGEAPTGFTGNNIGGGPAIDPSSTDFGIYAVTSSGPNLVAQIKGITLGSLGSVGTVNGIPVDGQNSTFTDPNHLGGDTSINAINGRNYLGVGVMYNLDGSAFENHVSFV